MNTEEVRAVTEVEMKPNDLRTGFSHQALRHIIIIICAALLVSGNLLLSAQQVPQQAAQLPADQSVRIPQDQLDSLVAPIALYPDPLVSQVLVASTYPLEIIQL